MKIGIVGGLGYLGSVVARLASMSNDVTIVDSNLYGLWGQDEVDEYFVGRVKWINGCFSDLTAEAIADCRLVFYFVDHSYVVDSHNEVILSHKDILNRLESKTKVVMTIDKRLHASMKEFFSNGKHVYLCPELYGMSAAFRSDTLINGMLCDFALYKNHVLEKYMPHDVIRFADVAQYAESLIRTHVYDSTECNPEIYCSNAISIAMMIQYVCGSENVLNVSPLGVVSDPVDIITGADGNNTVFQHQVNTHKFVDVLKFLWKHMNEDRFKSSINTYSDRSEFWLKVLEMDSVCRLFHKRYGGKSNE